MSCGLLLAVDDTPVRAARHATVQCDGVAEAAIMSIFLATAGCAGEGGQAIDGSRQVQPRFTLHVGVSIVDDPAGKGVLVVKVVAGSMAEIAGLRAGDVVLAIDGAGVRSAEKVLVSSALWQPDKPIVLTVLRDGREVTMPIFVRSDLVQRSVSLLKMGRHKRALDTAIPIEIQTPAGKVTGWVTSPGIDAAAAVLASLNPGDAQRLRSDELIASSRSEMRRGLLAIFGRADERVGINPYELSYLSLLVDRQLRIGLRGLVSDEVIRRIHIAQERAAPLAAGSITLEPSSRSSLEWPDPPIDADSLRLPAESPLTREVTCDGRLYRVEVRVPGLAAVSLAAGRVLRGPRDRGQVLRVLEKARERVATTIAKEYESLGEIALSARTYMALQLEAEFWAISTLRGNVSPDSLSELEELCRSLRRKGGGISVSFVETN